MCITAILSHVFISFSIVRIYDLSYVLFVTVAVVVVVVVVVVAAVLFVFSLLGLLLCS